MFTHIDESLMFSNRKFEEIQSFGNCTTGRERLSRVFLQGVDPERADFLAANLCHRSELWAFTGSPSTQIMNMLGSLGFLNPLPFEFSVYRMTAELRTAVFEELFQIIERHNELLQQVQPIELQLPQKADFGLRMEYTSSSWGGIGAIRFYMKDTQTEDWIPVYILRGNPHADVFDVICIQSWISELEPSIKYLTLGKSSILGNIYGRLNIPIKQTVKSSSRLQRRFVRNINAGRRDLSEVDIEDAVLILGIAYLAKFDFHKFRGLSQEIRTCLDDPEIIAMYSVDYKRLFGRWFQPVADQQYPWAQSIEADSLVQEIPDRLLELFKMFR
ncbi:MAG: hypothetical protein ABIE03_03515 [Patescibacteria group bacterium]|nr:hypothetical protein [Patescibacteria group bacterium]